MIRLKTALLGLLLVQLALIALLYWSGRPQTGLESQLLLNALDVDRLLIRDADQSVLLARTTGGWVFPDENNAPADGPRIERLLDRVRGLQTGWPVATTVASHARFEVAADSYQRHVQLFSSDTQVAEFWVGTSPGFRKVHVRRSGDDAVYAVTLNSFELPTRLIDWQPPPPPPEPIPDDTTQPGTLLPGTGASVGAPAASAAPESNSLDN